jgi:hypothetical protein
LPQGLETSASGICPELVNALSPHGLILRGGFKLDAEDAPLGPSGAPARSVLLVGQAGGAPWPHFLRWCETQSAAGLKDPLDTWSRQIIGAVAQEFGARAVSPSDKPYLPFQQWAMRGEGLRPSPLGILMHPQYGLWHAYRGALLFETELAIPRLEKPIHLCDLCVGKPCLKACPAGAHSEAGFAHEACLSHVRGLDGALCRDYGCLDRNACPYGTEYRYPIDVQAFHMAAFAGI